MDLLETTTHVHHLSKRHEPSGHVHEFLGSTHLAEKCDCRHNHRFAGVTCRATHIDECDHVHEFITYTDFFEDHLHEVVGFTGPAIPVGCGKHVHFAEGVTTINDGHEHYFEFATLIGPSPITD